jgi:hypothetical protein
VRVPTLRNIYLSIRSAIPQISERELHSAPRGIFRPHPAAEAKVAPECRSSSLLLINQVGFLAQDVASTMYVPSWASMSRVFRFDRAPRRVALSSLSGALFQPNALSRFRVAFLSLVQFSHPESPPMRIFEPPLRLRLRFFNAIQDLNKGSYFRKKTVRTYASEGHPR